MFSQFRLYFQNSRIVFIMDQLQSKPDQLQSKTVKSIPRSKERGQEIHWCVVKNKHWSLSFLKGTLSPK